jgi:hypothetical protein
MVCDNESQRIYVKNCKSESEVSPIKHTSLEVPGFKAQKRTNKQKT